MNIVINHPRWCTPVTLALGGLGKEDHKFKVSVNYTVRQCVVMERKAHSACLHLSDLNLEKFCIYKIKIRTCTHIMKSIS